VSGSGNQLRKAAPGMAEAAGYVDGRREHSENAAAGTREVPTDQDWRNDQEAEHERRSGQSEPPLAMQPSLETDAPDPRVPSIGPERTPHSPVHLTGSLRRRCLLPLDRKSSLILVDSRTNGGWRPRDRFGTNPG
jgi:hypothetical protein